MWVVITEAALLRAIAVDHLTETLFLEEEADIERYRLAFQHLRGTALSPHDSPALVRRYTDEEHAGWEHRT